VHKFDSGAKLDAKLSGLYVGADNAMYRVAPSAIRPAAAAARLVKSRCRRARPDLDRQVPSGRFEGHALAFGWDGGYQTGTTRAASAIPPADDVRCRAATSSTMRRSRAWPCTARTSGTSRRAGRSTWARAGKASAPAPKAIPSPGEERSSVLSPLHADPVQAARHQGRPAAPGRDPHLQGAGVQQPDPAPLHLGQQQPDRAGFDRQPEPEAGTGAGHRRGLRALLGRGRAAVGQRVERRITDYTRRPGGVRRRALGLAPRPTAAMRKRYGSSWKPSSR
jgi:hypothetical protein